MSRQCRSKVELIQLGSAHDKYGVWTKPYASIQQGEKQKRCHPKSDFRLWQAAYFSTKNSINKPTAMYNRSFLIAAVFHFVHPVQKHSQKHHELTQNSVSFSCQRKQVPRCCINFPHELTCQILTNQSIKLDLERDQRVTMVRKVKIICLPHLYF